MIDNLPMLLEDAKRKVARLQIKEWRFKNPTLSTQKRQSDLFKGLISSLGESEGKSAWSTYIRALKDKRKRLAFELKEARLYLRYLKSIDRIQNHESSR